MDPPASGPGANYNKLVNEHLQSTFEAGFDSYEEFEISDYSWVHSVKGYSWFTCVRFQDRGHTRTYALFIKDNEVIDARYAVETDGCGTRTYSPFALTEKPAGKGVLQPLY